MSCKLEPAIWSRGTGQRITCFDRCQLIIVGMSNINKVHGKLRLYVSFLEYGRHVVIVVRTRPRAIPLAKITMRKSTHGFPFLSHAWWVWGSSWRPGAPLLIPTCICRSKWFVTRYKKQCVIYTWPILHSLLNNTHKDIMETKLIECLKLTVRY